MVKTQKLSKKRVVAVTGKKATKVTPEDVTRLMAEQQERLDKTGIVHCFRCEREWQPKTPERGLPVVCNFCKNPRWFVPRPEARKAKTTPFEQRCLDTYLAVLRGGSMVQTRAIRSLIESEAARLEG